MFNWWTRAKFLAEPMRRGWTILGLGLLVGVMAYAGVYFVGTAHPRHWLQNPRPELAWLKQEYHVPDAEFARLTQLHEAYLAQCQARCQQTAALNCRLQQALHRACCLTPTVRALLLERAQLQAQCQREMLEHFFAVSRTMPPAQGHRYLAWVQQHTCLAPSAPNELASAKQIVYP